MDYHQFAPGSFYFLAERSYPRQNELFFCGISRDVRAGSACLLAQGMLLR
ncbi:hypothetical protein HMPREF1141_1002 [Clostridium sp. MSTE9]|nr:hypothetical protein HMPREF1141_1002 [Clostridium sp. MSTE9]